MKNKEKVLTVTIRDCEVQTFRAGGPGGQNQNKRDTAVRIIHHPSGARGESREERTQLANKRIAFRRMAETVAFKRWVYEMHEKLEPIDVLVERQMDESNIKVEVRDEKGRWVESNTANL